MRKIIALLLLAATADAAPWIKDGLWFDRIPNPLPMGNGFAKFDPSEADFIATGARLPTQEELDARQAEADAAAAQAAAEAAAAHQAHFEALVPMATVYRIVMERNFGTGACTNRTVTETYVTTYFSTKLALGTITSLESSDSLFLLANTPKIMEFTGDGTIWSFPWSQVPEPGQ